MSADSGKKMNFTQTCNLLSQYVKDKRSLSNPGGTMNLFPVKDESIGNGCIGRTINLFPQTSGCFTPSPSKPYACASAPAAQMTIFYRGQVLVFNDLPNDKAKEVMDLASSFEPALKKKKVETTDITPPNPNPNTNTNPTINLSRGMNVGPNFGQGVIPATVPRPPVAMSSDLPIARKASLHRFLEKRKDRLVGKAPTSVDAAPSKPVEGKSWLGLASIPVYQPQQQI